MRGLRTQEPNEFNKFFSLVQKEAEKQGKVFFLDSEDGHDDILDDMELCDLFGWLVPAEKADAFERLWKSREETDDWIDSFQLATWDIDSNKNIKISFVKPPVFDLEDFGLGKKLEKIS